MKIDSEKLRKRLNKQRDINIRALDDPFSFNKGIVQSLCVLGQMEREEKGMKEGMVRESAYREFNNGWHVCEEDPLLAVVDEPVQSSL